jgi:hypothetical protein
LVVSKILGHANPTVTLLIYAHSNLESQTEAAALMDSSITPIPVDIQQLQPSATKGRSRGACTPQNDKNESKIRPNERIWSDRPGT